MRAAIVGAGVAGLVAARQLGLAGWHVDVYERSAGPNPSGYMMDFFGPGFDAAERIGLLSRLKEVSYRVDTVEYVDSAWRPTARLDYGHFYRVLNGRLLSLMRPDLERVLLTALDDVPEGRVQVHYGHRIGPAEEPIPDGVDLVIGADGIHSAVRRALFGDETTFLRDLGLRAAAFVVDEPDLHRLFTGRFVLTDAVGRQAGLYVLRGGRSGWAQRSCRDAASELTALADYERRWRPLVADKQAVGRRTAGTFLPDTRRALLLRRVFLRTASLPGIDRMLARRLAGMTGLAS